MEEIANENHINESLVYEEIIQKLNDSDEYSSSYRIEENGELHFYDFKYMKLSEDTIIVGIMNIDKIVNDAKEKEKLTKEGAKLEAEIARAKNKLSNQGFVSKAPANVIEAERTKLAEYEDLLAKNRKMLETVLAKLA